MAAAADTTSKARIGVLGASGYTGAELVRLLLRHPRTEIVLLTADRRAAGMGIFGGDGRQFVTESMNQMADGLVKFLRHLAAGGQPGTR